jgi:ABC-type transport system involved in multi-copper enzyme maturation permease subunit
MIPAIKSEFRKLFTVRTTYVLSGLALALTLFVTGYPLGYRAPQADLLNPGHLTEIITGTLTSVPLIFASIVAILLVTNEYRYNTILYTLSSSNNRAKILFAKLTATSVYALGMTVLLVAASVGAFLAGVHLKGTHWAPQHIDYASLAWRTLFYGWSSVVSSLVIALIIRSQVGAIVAVFVIPTTEVLIGGLLKTKAVYLPFTGASNSILVKSSNISHGVLSYGRAAIVFGIYLLIGWIVAWFLFFRRDAN